MPKKSEQGHHVCPWWAGYIFDNWLRRRIHPPEQILGAYVSKGMTVVDFGCGFSHFCLGMARLVGDAGEVIAVDLQQKALNKTMARARKASSDKIIHPLCCGANSVGLNKEVDFILASNSLHETPDPGATLREFLAALKPGCLLYLMEPTTHLEPERFEAEVEMAKAVGFVQVDRPKVRKEMCALLQKPASQESSGGSV